MKLKLYIYIYLFEKQGSTIVQDVVSSMGFREEFFVRNRLE